MGGQVAGIVLAAGFSRRLGRPKQLVELLGETLLERAIRTALAARLEPSIVVVNAAMYAAAAEKLKSSRCELVINEEARKGMASSIRCGLLALEGLSLDGAVLMTCDQVAVTPAHLKALCSDPELATGSRYAGRTGVPAYFPVSRFAELRALDGDQGARALLRDAQEITDEALALDLDTEEHVARAEAWLGACDPGRPVL